MRIAIPSAMTSIDTAPSPQAVSVLARTRHAQAATMTLAPGAAFVSEVVSVDDDEDGVVIAEPPM